MKINTIILSCIFLCSSTLQFAMLSDRDRSQSPATQRRSPSPTGRSVVPFQLPASIAHGSSSSNSSRAAGSEFDQFKLGIPKLLREINSASGVSEEQTSRAISLHNSTCAQSTTPVSAYITMTNLAARQQESSRFQEHTAPALVTSLGDAHKQKESLTTANSSLQSQLTAKDTEIASLTKKNAQLESFRKWTNGFRALTIPVAGCAWVYSKVLTSEQQTNPWVTGGLTGFGLLTSGFIYYNLDRRTVPRE